MFITIYLSQKCHVLLRVSYMVLIWVDFEGLVITNWYNYE